jgi:hypothetical protein
MAVAAATFLCGLLVPSVRLDRPDPA